MRIVLILPGLTKFIADKGSYGVEEGFSIDIVPGLPFEVPDSLGQARIKANPNLFRIATETDELFAQEYKAKKIAELNELIEGKKREVEATAEIVKGLEKPNDSEEFNIADFIAEKEPLTEEKLNKLERSKLFEIAYGIGLEFPKNIPAVKLIQQILDKVNEA